MRAAAVLVVLAACTPPPWRAVSPAPGAVYQYTPPIARYAPGDPGLWIVTAKGGSPEGRARVAGLLADPDDVLGDGFVAWLTDDRAASLRAHADVLGVVPLQPADRIGPLPGGAAVVPVRIDVAEGAADRQRDAVIAWLARRGVRASTPGPRTLDAELAPALARDLATLGPVRWVERRGR